MKKQTILFITASILCSPFMVSNTMQQGCIQRRHAHYNIKIKGENRDKPEISPQTKQSRKEAQVEMKTTSTVTCLLFAALLGVPPLMAAMSLLITRTK